MSRVHAATHRASGSWEAERLHERDSVETSRPEPASDGTGSAGHVVARQREEVGYQRLAQAVRAAWSGGRLFDLPLGAKVLLVVSSVHSEGASTVARNLAKRLGEGGKARVLLVDANLRRPTQQQALAVGRVDCLTGLVTKKFPATHQVVLRESEDGFSFLPCGDTPESPSEFFGNSETAQVVQDLRSRFDWIVIDGPPVTVYSDAALLARMADAAILVVKAEATRREVIAQAKRNLEETGLRILGVVLNRRRYHIPESVYRLLLSDDPTRSQH